MEKVIGIDFYRMDTNDDGFSDLNEIKSGYSPLIVGTAGKYSSEEWQAVKDKIKAADEGFYNEVFGNTIVNSNFICGTDTVSDVDGNAYNTVQIGDQCWLKENLKVTKNQAGEAITRYCYDNDSKICDTDGGLYDWNTAMNNSITEGAQGICPDGWHVPKDEEWYVLESGLKETDKTCDANRNGWDCDQAGTKLKAGGASGFDSFFVGNRGTNFLFSYKGLGASFWSSIERGDRVSLSRILDSSHSAIGRYESYKAYGFSVRCLKD